MDNYYRLKTQKRIIEAKPKKEKTVSISGGWVFAFVLLLTALKLAGKINVSWWFVFAPLWFIPVFVVTIFGLAALIALIGAMIK